MKLELRISNAELISGLENEGLGFENWEKLEKLVNSEDFAEEIRGYMYDVIYGYILDIKREKEMKARLG